MSFNEWKELQLQDICSYSKEKISIDEVNLNNYISTENMLADKGGITQSSGLPNAKTVSKYIPGNILISNIRPYFKKIWYGDRAGGASNDVLIFQNNPLIESKFLYYFLSQDKFFEFMTGTAKGTKMPRGDKEAIMRYSILVPSVSEQKAIANILSSLDEKIELNNQMNRTLEEMAQALFKRWFVDFEFPNENGEPYKSNGGEMVDSELGMIPKGWKVGCLGDIATFKNGKGLKSEFRTEQGANLVYGANGIIARTNEVLQQQECLVVGRVGAYCGSIQLSLNPAWITDNAIIGTTKLPEQLPYLYRFISGCNLRDMAGGSAQPLINQTILNNLKVIIPETEVLNKYCAIDLGLINKEWHNKEESNDITVIRDTLLPKLMSGEIRVTDLQN